MTKKLLLLLAVFASLMLSCADLNAASSAGAYLVVRCTATVSVELFDGGLYSATTHYNFGDVSAAGTYVSANPIGVRNNSVGVITRWEVDIPSIDNVNWGIDDQAGLGKMRICVKFTTAAPTSGDFDLVQDTVPYTGPQAGYASYTGPAKTYDPLNFYEYCSVYTEPTYTSDASRILPWSYDPIPNGKSERHMWIRLDTPTAIENPGVQAGITLRITAK